MSTRLSKFDSCLRQATCSYSPVGFAKTIREGNSDEFQRYPFGVFANEHHGMRVFVEVYGAGAESLSPGLGFLNSSSDLLLKTLARYWAVT